MRGMRNFVACGAVIINEGLFVCFEYASKHGSAVTPGAVMYAAARLPELPVW
jgi:hypothetical protein